MSLSEFAEDPDAPQILKSLRSIKPEGQLTIRRISPNPQTWEPAGHLGINIDRTWNINADAPGLDFSLIVPAAQTISLLDDGSHEIETADGIYRISQYQQS